MEAEGFIKNVVVNGWKSGRVIGQKQMLTGIVIKERVLN